MQKQCEHYLQLLDELQQVMKQMKYSGTKMDAQKLLDLEKQLEVILSEIQQMEKAILAEAGEFKKS